MDSAKLGFVAIYHPTLPLCLVEYASGNDHDFDLLRQHAVTDSRIIIFPKATTKKTDFEAAAKIAGFGKVDLDRFYVKIP